MNILMMTSVYRDDSLGKRDTSTNIVNLFVKEWIKQGHNVIVIHNSHCYPKIIYKIPNIIKDYLASKMGFAIEDYDMIDDKIYYDGGIKVYRIKIKKYIPHHTPNKKAIYNQVEKIKVILKNENFLPNIIVGHWASPQMELISNLKNIYLCKTAIVLHGNGYITSNSFNVKQYLNNIDIVGTRSITQSNNVKRILNLPYDPFVCYSGVPDNYLNQYKLNLKKFDHIEIWKFIYVGRLVKYKNIDVVIKALSKLRKSIQWEFIIAGDGGERKNLENLTKSYQCEDKVKFIGKISRDHVMELLKEAHSFIMVSTNEIFGLSYLEAMVASCITIGTKLGGIDGIIENEINGYLCKEEDEIELFNILNKIIAMNKNEIFKLVTKSYNTANEFSDSEVSKRYLKNISI